MSKMLNKSNSKTSSAKLERTSSAINITSLTKEDKLIWDSIITNFMVPFSNTVYHKRRELKMTQVQLANKSFTTRLTIQKIEKMQIVPNLSTALCILHALNLTLSIKDVPINSNDFVPKLKAAHPQSNTSVTDILDAT